MEQETTDYRPNTLDDVLTEDTSASQSPHEAAQEARQVHGAEPDGAGPDTSTGETHAGQDDAPPASETQDGEQGPEPTVPLRALQDERRKRQELAEQLASMEQQAASAARPDPFEDPEGEARPSNPCRALSGQGPRARMVGGGVRSEMSKIYFLATAALILAIGLALIFNTEPSVLAP